MIPTLQNVEKISQPIAGSLILNLDNKIKHFQETQSDHKGKQIGWLSGNIFLNDIFQERGMDDKRKVPFYPYRDDGKVLDSALKNFSRQFVSL